MRVALLLFGGSLLACAPRGDLERVEGTKACRVDEPSRAPLVVEWPSADRAALESRARSGAVVLRYEACELEVLSSCTARGGYEFEAVTPKREQVSIRSRDELHARLPVGAVSLEAALDDSDRLAVDMTIVGHERLSRGPVARSELQGQCEDATHVVSGFSVGAFTLASERDAVTEAGVKRGAAGLGGSRMRGKTLLASDGERARCTAIRPVGEAPHGCSGVLHIEASPLTDSPAIDPGEPEDGDALDGPLQAGVTTYSRDGKSRALRALYWDEALTIPFVLQGQQWEAVVRAAPLEGGTVHVNIRRGAEVMYTRRFLLEREGNAGWVDVQMSGGNGFRVSVRPTRPGPLFPAPASPDEDAVP